MKFRYRKEVNNWVFIPIRERFINNLGIGYGIKKKNRNMLLKDLLTE